MSLLPVAWGAICCSSSGVQVHRGKSILEARVTGFWPLWTPNRLGIPCIPFPAFSPLPQLQRGRHSPCQRCSGTSPSSACPLWVQLQLPAVAFLRGIPSTPGLAGSCLPAADEVESPEGDGLSDGGHSPGRAVLCSRGTQRGQGRFALSHRREVLVPVLLRWGMLMWSLLLSL